MIRSILFALLALTACTTSSSQDRKTIGGCDGCDLMFTGMPTTINSETQVSPSGEKGEPLVITGTIYKPDGHTYAPGIVLYLYHTDANGEYSKTSPPNNSTKHGHLRGWVKTDDGGRYKFTTIRPASYPNSKIPQHIHPIIYEPGKGYYWIDEYLFEDDPYLTSKERNAQPGRGGKGIIRLTKDASGTWKGTRDIVLGKNIPGYK